MRHGSWLCKSRGRKSTRTICLRIQRGRFVKWNSDENVNSTIRCVKNTFSSKILYYLIYNFISFNIKRYLLFNIKIYIQLQEEPLKGVGGGKYQGIIQSIKLIRREEGALAFWKGIFFYNLMDFF